MSLSYIYSKADLGGLHHVAPRVAGVEVAQDAYILTITSVCVCVYIYIYIYIYMSYIDISRERC